MSTLDADFPKPSFFLGEHDEQKSPAFKEKDLNQDYKEELSFGKNNKECDNAGSSDEESFIEVKVVSAKEVTQNQTQEGEFMITRMM